MDVVEPACHLRLCLICRLHSKLGCHRGALGVMVVGGHVVRTGGVRAAVAVKGGERQREEAAHNQADQLDSGERMVGAFDFREDVDACRIQKRPSREYDAECDCEGGRQHWDVPENGIGEEGHYWGCG